MKQVVEWLWRGRGLKEALANAPHAAVREDARRAKVAAELGDRALDPIEPLRSGSSLPLSVTLYREATYWALAALAPGTRPIDLSSALAMAQNGVLLQAAGSEGALASVRRTLVEQTFVDSALSDVAALERDARAAQTFVHALLERATAAERRKKTLLLQRWSRVAGMIATLILLLLLGRLAVESIARGPDLAQDKRWRVSSKSADCEPEWNQCAGVHTAILFHTEDEREPWFEIDLESPQSFSRVEVENRRDCCMERAVPLIIEVSLDRSQWREVARRVEPFASWETQFSPVTARYVRARVAKQTMFHLEGMAVRAR
jgi:hypothetical protein